MASNPLKEKGIRIEQHIDRPGQDCQLEREGPHPVEDLRAREIAGA